MKEGIENKASGTEACPAVAGGTYAFPLTYAQRQLWFLNELDPGNVSYNIPWSIQLMGAVDVEALEQSLNEIVRRHESLRTTFITVDGEPVQIIAEDLWIPLRITSLDHLERREREAAALRRAAEEGGPPVDLANGPLLRAELIRLDAAKHLLLLTLHHIIFDAWSRRVFARELAILYEAFKDGKPSQLPHVAVQYADYAIWQREF